MSIRTITQIMFLAAVSAAAQPSVAPGAVLNAASYTPSGLPGAGIAQGSMFVVFGTGLGPQTLERIQSLPLPGSLARTSVSVTVAGKTVGAPLFYTSNTQLAAVMPSYTPAGAGTLRVVYNGGVSAAVPVQVVRNAPGILTLNSAGYGPAVVQNYNSATDQPVNTAIEAAHPGQTEILWATGLGPIAADDSNTPPVGNLPFQIQVFVGGKSAKVSYAGRSAQFPGIDQIAFDVPSGVSGCQVPVAVKVEGVMSNYATMAVSPQGKICSDWHAFSMAEMQAMAGTPLLRVGSILIGQTHTVLATAAGTVSSMAEDVSGQFYGRGPYQALYGMGPRTGAVMLGSCNVYSLRAADAIQWTPNDPAAGSQYFDAGATLTFTGPNGQVQVARNGSGAFSGTVAGTGQNPYLVAGQHSANNGSGGSQVGPFQAQLSVPPAITWTNADAVKDVVRTKPLTITWQGGDASREFVVITGSSLDVASGAMAAFVCAERIDPAQFAIPAEVLSALPAASAWTADGYPAGLLSVGAMPILSSARFTAPGLDGSYFSYSRQELRNVNYK